jgi:NhaA family Na+:H+ antiporter
MSHNIHKSRTKDIWFKNEMNQSIVAIFSLLIGLGFSMTQSFKGIYDYKEPVLHFLFPFFFFYVSLEARRQIVSDTGHLKGKKALQPLLMAIGGVLVPMCIFGLIFPQGFTPEGGMFIPIATDIAFVVLAMKPTKISDKLKTTILAIAIADDIIAIVLIVTCFGSWDLGKVMFLIIISIIVGISMIMQNKIDSFRITRESTFWLIVCGVLIYLLHTFNIHTTLAGVITALLIPYHPGAKRIEKSKKVEDSVYHYLEENTLNILSGWIIIPAFIILSVNIPFQKLNINDMFHRSSIAIILGLSLGKTIGIFVVGIITSFFFGKPGENKKEFLGGAMLCGIGFTVSLLFAALSKEIAKGISAIAILCGSLISAIMGISTIGLKSKKSIDTSYSD